MSGLVVKLPTTAIPASAATCEWGDVPAPTCVCSIVNSPASIYDCSDGSVFSNGVIDDSVDGSGKGSGGAQ